MKDIQEVTATDKELKQSSDNDLSALAEVLDYFLQPDDITVVCGALDAEKIKKIAQSGIEHVINLQPSEELTFDEKAAVEQAGMAYSHLPIQDENDLVQLKMLAFDKVLREHHGKKTLLHCQTGDKVGAAVALRQGWLRGRKMDTALSKGHAHGLTTLKDEVYQRLLVPR